MHKCSVADGDACLPGWVAGWLLENRKVSLLLLLWLLVMCMFYAGYMKGFVAATLFD